MDPPEIVVAPLSVVSVERALVAPTAPVNVIVPVVSAVNARAVASESTVPPKAMFPPAVDWNVTSPTSCTFSSNVCAPLVVTLFPKIVVPAASSVTVSEPSDCELPIAPANVTVLPPVVLIVSVRLFAARSESSAEPNEMFVPEITTLPSSRTTV